MTRRQWSGSGHRLKFSRLYADRHKRAAGTCRPTAVDQGAGWMTDKSDETAETPYDGARSVRDDVERRHGAGHHDAERKHHPDADRHHTPHRPASALPHTMGQVPLDEILARNPKAERRRVPR